MAATLNTAYRNCSGDIICLLDADDTFLPGRIEAVVNALCAHPQAGFAIRDGSRSAAVSRYVHAVNSASMVDNQQQARGVYPLLSALPSGDCAQITYDNSGILMGLPPTTNLALRREVADRIFPLPVEYTGYSGSFATLCPVEKLTHVCGRVKGLLWRALQTTLGKHRVHQWECT